MIVIVGVVRLVRGGLDGMTLIGLAVLIEYLVRTEARMLEDGGYFDDGVFGYDFSEGYTSLESGAPKVRPYRESALKRWRRRRSELRRQRRVAREAAEERRMDEILEKLHREGRGPDGRRKSVPGPRQRTLSQPDEKHVNEPSGPAHRPCRRSDRSRPERAAIVPRGDRRAVRWSWTPAWARGSWRWGSIRWSDDPALWNLSRPGDVLAIHRRDVAAGSGAILTNTFGANRFWLREFGRAGAVESINRRAVELARGAAGPGRFVFGDLGPTAAHGEGAAAEQAAILVDAGVDALIFETYRFSEVEAVLREVSRSLAAPIPLLVSLWEWPDPVGPAARRLLDLGAAVIGMNCQAGIEAAVAFAERLDGQLRCPLLVKPSAGTPSRPDDDPGSFAAAVPGLLDRNVRLLGGCCGTSDAHVAALAAACARVDPISLPTLAGETR